MTFQYPIKRLVLSHSARSTAKRCWRQFEFSKMYGDPVIKNEQFAAEVGQAIHRGFQEYMISRDENKALLAMMAAYPYALEYSDKNNHYTRSLEAVYATLENMIHSDFPDRYELIHIKTQLPELKDKSGKIIREANVVMPAVEVPFAFEILNAPLPIPVWFVGFIDLILFDRLDKRYLVNDIKSNRINVPDYSGRYEFDEQCVPYGIVLEHALGKIVEEFDVSYLSAYVDLLEPKSQMYKFTKTPENIRDWHYGLCEDIGRISKYYKTAFFPRSTTGEACFSFNKPCWYLGECSNRNPEITQRLLNTNIREGLFHDDQEPWITAKLEYVEV